METYDQPFHAQDPMPPPARCGDLANASRATAVFERRGGEWLLEVTVSLPTEGAYRDASFRTGAAITTSEWDTVVSSKATAHTAQATVRLKPGTAFADVMFPVECAANQEGALEVVARPLDGTISFPEDGSAPPQLFVHINDG